MIIIDFDFTARFLIFLFEKEKCEVNTIRSYLAVLKQPLSLEFIIDLDDGRVSNILKSFGSKDQEEDI